MKIYKSFEEWWSLNIGQNHHQSLTAEHLAEMAWDSRQAEIDELKKENEKLREAVMRTYKGMMKKS